MRHWILARKKLAICLVRTVIRLDSSKRGRSATHTRNTLLFLPWLELEQKLIVEVRVQMLIQAAVRVGRQGRLATLEKLHSTGWRNGEDSTNGKSST